MYRIILSFAFLFSLTFFLRCNDNSISPIEEKTNSLLPLSVGNTWNYKLYSSASDSIGQVNWNIIKMISVNEKEYYLISSIGLDDKYYVARNETSGLFFSIYDSTNGFTSPFFFKYPAVDNETYQYQIPDTDSILTITVKKQNLTINNHIYDCYGYINENLNPYFPFMYFEENIGLIRHKLVIVSGSGIDTTHYIVYDLQNKVLNN